MKLIYVSPGIQRGEKIAYLFCNDDEWIAISEKEKTEMYREQEIRYSEEDAFEPITEEELISRIPSLKNQLTEEEGKFITIDYKNGKVYVNPLHKRKSTFSNDRARATNQANFSANTWTYIKNRKHYYLKILCVVLALLAASFLISWGLLILLFWVIVTEIIKIQNDLDSYLIGTLNAAVVVTTNPTRIATLTDVSMGLGKFPLVRICKLRLPKKYNNLSQRIPCSCGYNNTEDQKFWDFVLVNPLVYGTNDDEIIKQKINEIPTQDWVDLMNWVKSNKSNFYEGYYPIREGNNNWTEYENPIFTAFYEEKRPS